MRLSQNELRYQKNGVIMIKAWKNLRKVTEMEDQTKYQDLYFQRHSYTWRKQK